MVAETTLWTPPMIYALEMCMVMTSLVEGAVNSWLYVSRLPDFRALVLKVTTTHVKPVVTEKVLK